jgi:hypothetical protein
MVIIYSIGLIIGISSLIIIIRKIYSTGVISNIDRTKDYKIVNNDIKGCMF